MQLIRRFREQARSHINKLFTDTNLSRQAHPSKQTDIKVYLSFLLLYPAQAFSKARIYQIYQQT
ncbi:hypothetical protein EMIT0P12_20942 [Pseudomonas sp. IT-P12]